MPRGKKKVQTEEVNVQTTTASPEIAAEAPAPKKRGGRPKKNKDEITPVSAAPAVEAASDTPAPKKCGRKVNSAAETAPAHAEKDKEDISKRVFIAE